MNIFSLSGNWQFRQVGTDEWLPANVPGGVHTDLLAAGHIPNPFVGDNEKHVQWVAENDWEYRRSFLIDPDLAVEDQIFLVCDGLDTLATVYFNGSILGKTDNMFRQFRWDVKPLIKASQLENEILVKFASPVRYVSQKQASQPLLGVSQAIPGGPHLRKAPCQFGWDWGPQLPPIGIWKDLRLEGYTQARISETRIHQYHQDGQITIETHVTVERFGSAQLSINTTITAPDGEIFHQSMPLPEGSVDAVIKIVINDPKLWWPNGYGKQELYQVDIHLSQPDVAGRLNLDRRALQIGLRTIELRQAKDEWGRSFEFIVNGVRIFAKGSNWIPANSFPTRVTDEHLERLIRAAAESHQNMLRVWGGGFYEDERFYDLCDRYGILVWQEFIFACSAYPWDEPEFIENFKVEAVQNIRRLRHRASLALWCGNNEIEWGWSDWNWQRSNIANLKTAYDLFYNQTLPGWCSKEDPDHAYWPSSPSSDTPNLHPNSQEQGDAHYWDVWHGRKPFTAYRSQFPRFMSEFGFQALPPFETIKTYASEADWNMTSYVMEQHQKNDSGNGLIVGQMLDTFRLPKDFSSLSYLSMVLQAEGIRYGVEHWRRHMDRVAGTLYWQLNDCWPVASWSSLDYFGRWKALHYAARRFYAPLMLSIEDQSPRQELYISSDLGETWKGSIHWSLETFKGEILESGEEEVQVAPRTAAHICTLDFAEQVTDARRRELVFVAELWQEGRRLNIKSSYFRPNQASVVGPTGNCSNPTDRKSLLVD